MRRSTLSCNQESPHRIECRSGTRQRTRALAQKHRFPIVLELAGLRRVRLYDLRDTAPTLALMAGVPPKSGIGATSVVCQKYVPSGHELSAVVVVRRSNQSAASRTLRIGQTPSPVPASDTVNTDGLSLPVDILTFQPQILNRTP